MTESSIDPRSRMRQAGICGCAIAALLAGAAARASTLTPSISGTPQTTGVTGRAYSFTPAARGPRGYKLRFTIYDKPSWGSFSATTGRLSGTPRVPGTYSNIVIGVTDGVARAALRPFSIRVSRSPGRSTALRISGSPATAATVAKAYSFMPTATKPSGKTLRFTILDRPSWAAFSTANGRLSGTPKVPGTYSNIVIGVTDGVSRATLRPFSIRVSAPANTGGASLRISGSPATSAIVAKAYSFTPTVTKPAGKTLRFTIIDKPSWGSFSTTTGRLFGTPQRPGTYSSIVIGVTDGVAKATLPAFTVNVAGAASTTAPTISGTAPTSVAVAGAYSFTPKATDPDGDPLSFSVQNKPSWASFSIATGRLSGTPGVSNVGTTSGIVISVSDTHTTASLAPFSITVAQPAGSGGSGSGSTGSATLSWTAPTTNTNGSALTDLAGYHIYYGTSRSAMTKTITVPNPGTTSYTITGLATGTWYFAVNAYTTGSLDSVLSNTGSKAIP